jgi:diacylglycerol kinase
VVLEVEEIAAALLVVHKTLVLVAELEATAVASQVDLVETV